MRKRVTVLAVAGAACAALVVRDPSNDPFLPCPFRMMTGLDCPFCGTTRAAHALVHGRAGDAFGFNPLVLAVALYALVFTLRRRPVPAPPMPVLLAIAIGFGILRNLPFGPLRWMRA